jgi:hypothetical protein
VSDKTYNRSINIFINGKEVENNIAAIKKEMYALVNAQARMTVGSEEYVKKTAEIRRLKQILDDHNQSLKVSNGLWSKIGGILPVASVSAFALKLLQTSKQMLDLSKRMESDARRASIVFGDSLGYVEEKAEKLSKRMGVTNNEFIAMSAQTADLLIPLGFARQRAAEMSVQLQSLTGALDEWTGGSIGAAEISTILTKAMLGENEQLKQLGIAIRKDSEEYRDLVKQKKEETGATTAQAEAMATLELIMKKSVDAQTAYTTEGNKLLRTQKEAGRWWRTMKENVVEYFKADAVDKLQAEGKAVNKLTTELYNVNTPAERRAEIYEQLKTLAPDIVKSLDDEKKATLATRDALIEYNKQLVNKIILQGKDEEIEEQTNKIAAANLKKVEKEDFILKEIMSSMERYPKRADEINKILASKSTVLKKLQDLQNIGVGLDKEVMSPVTGQMTGVFENYIKDYQKQLQDAEAKIESEQAILEKLIDERLALMQRLDMGGDSTGGSGTEGGGGDSTGGSGGGGGDDTKDDKFNILNLYKLNRKSIEKSVKDLRKNIDDAYEKLRPKWMENTIKDAEFRAEVDKEVNDKIIKQREDLIEKEREQYADKVQLYIDYASRVGEILGQAIADGEISAKQAAKQLLILALDSLRNFANLYIAQAMMREVGTKGFIGLGTGTALAVIINTVLAGITSSLKKNLYTGGFTGWGGIYEPAGIVGDSVIHKREWVANSALVSSPVYGPMIEALEQVQRGGLSAGGYAGNNQVPGTATVPAAFTDPEMKALMRANLRLLNMLEKEGVRTYFGMKEADGVRRTMNKLTELEDSVSL